MTLRINECFEDAETILSFFRRRTDIAHILQEKQLWIDPECNPLFELVAKAIYLEEHRELCYGLLRVFIDNLDVNLEARMKLDNAAASGAFSGPGPSQGSPQVLRDCVIQWTRQKCQEGGSCSLAIENSTFDHTGINANLNHQQNCWITCNALQIAIILSEDSGEESPWMIETLLRARAPTVWYADPAMTTTLSAVNFALSLGKQRIARFISDFSRPREAKYSTYLRAAFNNGSSSEHFTYCKEALTHKAELERDLQKAQSIDQLIAAYRAELERREEQSAVSLARLRGEKKLAMDTCNKRIQEEKSLIEEERNKYKALILGLEDSPHRCTEERSRMIAQEIREINELIDTMRRVL